jgi:carbamoyl-phosphate synthase large subunit
MPKRILIVGAGTAASQNLLRSLKAADSDLVVAGCHHDRFVLNLWSGDSKYLVPRFTAPTFPEVLKRIIESEQIDLVIPTSDAEVEAVSRVRDRISGSCFLPEAALIELCRDKHRTVARLRAAGIRAPETHAVTDLDEIESIFARFGDRIPLWCRPRSGTCARGGGAVHTPDQARRWIRMWDEMRGIRPTDFALSEYLPGREILCQSLWRDGSLVLSNTFERISYFGADNIPSGVTSLSSLAKTVVDPRAVKMCADAIRVLAPHASGAFSIDVKEDALGVPYITEINAGRLFMAMTAFDSVLKYSMSLTYVRLGLGETVGLQDEYDAVEGYYLVRDLDVLPGIFHADELLRGFSELTS